MLALDLKPSAVGATSDRFHATFHQTTSLDDMSDFAETTRVAADQLVDDCMQTFKLCRPAAAHCIDQGGELATLSRLQALDDCAEVNLTMSNFLLRGSRHVRPLAALCMEVSRAAAEALEAVEHHDAHLRAAYAACLRSHRACAELLGEREDAAYTVEDLTSSESFPASDPPPPPTEV